MGSLCQQTGLSLGTVLQQPVGFDDKNNALGKPLLALDRLLALATPEQVDQLRTTALKSNTFPQGFFLTCGIILVDFKLEFGLDQTQRLILADEISPATDRLWKQTAADPNQRVMDKDRFRHALGNVALAYQQVMERVLQQRLS